MTQIIPTAAGIPIMKASLPSGPLDRAKNSQPNEKMRAASSAGRVINIILPGVNLFMREAPAEPSIVGWVGAAKPA
jgi:hypothetical protein